MVHPALLRHTYTSAVEYFSGQEPSKEAAFPWSSKGNVPAAQIFVCMCNRRSFSLCPLCEWIHPRAGSQDTYSDTYVAFGYIAPAFCFIRVGRPLSVGFHLFAGVVLSTAAVPTYSSRRSPCRNFRGRRFHVSTSSLFN